MKSKNLILIIIVVVIIIAGIIFANGYVLTKDEQDVQTVETKSFKFNTTLNDNWTFYKDHEYGYSYHSPINNSRIMFYNNSMSNQGFYEQIDDIGWPKLTNLNISDDIKVYESHFDGDTAVSDSTHNYYSAFLELKDGYVHVSSLDLNRTLTIANAINEANN